MRQSELNWPSNNGAIRLPLRVLLVCNWLRFSCQAEVSGPDTSWVKDEPVKILFPILGRSPDFISTQVVRYHKYNQTKQVFEAQLNLHVNLPLSKAYAMLSLKATYSPKLGKVVRTRSKQFHGVSLCLVMGSCLQRGICLIERHLLLLPVWTACPNFKPHSLSTSSIILLGGRPAMAGGPLESRAYMH